MRFRNPFAALKDEGRVIAIFGQARLLKHLDGKYELCGGSKEDRQAVREWISLFCHEIVAREA
jgi:hypothetical protein